MEVKPAGFSCIDDIFLQFNSEKVVKEGEFFGSAEEKAIGEEEFNNSATAKS